LIERKESRPSPHSLVAMRVNPVSLGFVWAVFLALSQVLWAGMVAAGLAQTFVDFICWALFLRNPFVVEAFEPSRAAVLVLSGAVLGYVGGLIAGSAWNSIYHEG
jgi:hypothetical protein